MNMKHYIGWLGLLTALICVVSPVGARDTVRYEFAESVSICRYELPYTWRNQFYPESGEYEQTVFTPDHRTDSGITYVDTMRIYRLRLDAFSYYYANRTVDIRYGSSITYKGQTYDQPTDIYDTITYVDDCDTVLHTQLRFMPEWHFYDTAHFCSGSSYRWRGQTLTAYGDYYDSLTTKVGQYDSIYQLHLIEHNAIHVYDTATICENESYRWMNNTYHRSGDYTVPLRRYGCDSTRHLHLVVLPVPEPIRTTIYFCANTGEITHGVKVQRDTTFYDTIAAVNGCDSVRITHYIPYPTHLFEEVIQHFAGETITWRGKQFTNDTIYLDTIPGGNQFGCDSIYQLRLITKYDISRVITTCEGNTIRHGSTLITSNTEFTDTLKTAAGADSIIHTAYNFQPPFFLTDTLPLCENTQIPWTGHLDPETPSIIDPVTGEEKPNYIMLWAKADGQENHFYDRHLTEAQCDSIYEMVVIGLPAYLHDTVVIWCNDTLDKYSQFEWRGHVISQHNVDTIICDTLNHTQADPLTHTMDGSTWDAFSGGCDSIERLHLIITDRCSPVERIPLCRGEKVTVDGKIYSEPGIYANTMPSSRGLNLPDSTHRFEIFIAEPAYMETELVVCESETPYNWYGQLLRKNGIYETHLSTVYGCDSLVKLHFTVIPTVFSEVQTYHFCSGSETAIELPSHRVITPDGKEGDYTDTLKHIATYTNMDGETRMMECDSIVRIHVIGHESYFFNETANLKEGGSYIWHQNGQTRVLTEPNVYWDSCVSVYGCDSVYRLYLKEVHSWYNKDSAYVCKNELPHLWHGKEYWKAGIYFDSLPTQDGMDSVFEHEVFILPSYIIDTVVNICHDTKYTINGKEIPIGEGISTFFYDDTLKTHGTGCDSIYRYEIRRFPKDIHSDGVVYVQEGESYQWRGKECINLGNYYDTIWSSVTGCDSIIYTFELRHDHPYLYIHKDTVCMRAHSTYSWRGRVFNTDIDTVYIATDSLRTTFLHLDSVYRLELTVAPTYFYSEAQYICPGEGVNFGSRYITEPGIYVDTFHTANIGCDSIHRLILNPSPTYFFKELITYVEDSELPIEWHRKSLPGEGIYYDSLLTTHAHPCDSVHQVEVLKKDYYHFDQEASICEGEYVEFFGTKYYTSGVYTQAYTTVHTHMDSIYTLNLTVNPVKTTRIVKYLCEGQSYNFHGVDIYDPGIYRDTLINPVTLCDSIVELVIDPYNTAAVIVNDTLCAGPGNSLWIGNTEVTHAGIYRDTLTAISNGCDSVVEHIVTVGQPYYAEEARVIDKGNTYTWHQNGVPVILDKEGDYFDSCLTVLGCDSVMKLTLRFSTQMVFPTLFDTICYSDLPYIWNTYPIARAITEEGLYYDTCKAFGVDTIRSLDLTILPVTRGQETLDYCDGEQVEFNGIIYNDNAVVHKTIMNSKGCDSIVTYYLQFHPKYAISKTVKLTTGDSIVMKGVPNAEGKDSVIRTEGIYKFKLYSVHGCDSLITLIVNTCEGPKLNVIQYDMCQGDVLTIDGRKQITQSGDYDFFFRSADGCDSIVRYVVRFNPAYEFNSTATMCVNSSYTWYGHKNDTVITRQGTYYDSLKTHLGCDSVYCLKLTYTRTDLRDTIVSVCYSDLPYSYKGQLYYENHVFYDTLANNTEGCDSVLRWNYYVNMHCSEFVHYNRCVGHYLTVDGEPIDKEGIYLHHHLTEEGMDSLYRFTVHDIPNYEFTTELRGCDSIVYKGKTYYARGIGQETFMVDLNHRTTEGCDSLEHLILTINMSSPTHVYSKTIADFDSVRFGPYFYNTTGDYPLSYTNAKGCDSIEVLHLTVLQTKYEDMIHYYMCYGDPKGVTVFGRNIHPTEDYTFIADTVWIAGQPIIRTADIIVQYPFGITRFEPDENQIVCSAHEATFYVSYTTSDPNRLPDYYEVDFMAGDIEAHPIHQEGEVNGKTTLAISMNGQGKYITPGYYRYFLKLRSASCSVSDTVLQSSVLVRYPNDIMESAWNDAVMLVNERHNGGGWIFQPPFKWQVFSAEGRDKTALVVTNSTQPYLYSSALEEGDRISATLMREGYDKAIPSCEYIFTPVYPVAPHATLVYPSAVRANMPVTVSSPHNGLYRLLDNTGHTYQNGAFQEGKTEVRMPGTEGCYIMVIEDEQGNHQAQKLIVY